MLLYFQPTTNNQLSFSNLSMNQQPKDNTDKQNLSTSAPNNHLQESQYTPTKSVTIIQPTRHNNYQALDEQKYNKRKLLTGEVNNASLAEQQSQIQDMAGPMKVASQEP